MSDSYFPEPTDLGYLMDPTKYAQYAQKTQQSNNEYLLENAPKEAGKDNTNLTFEDMLMLMVTQLQNQTIDNQADTNDMMNQLIQMTVMQALTEMSSQVEDLTNANIMSYSASLVGKEVTIGVVDERTGTLAEEIVGTVTATGTYNGQQVIFLGDKYYPLSSIMAVGTLPEQAVDGTGKTPAEEEGADGGDGADVAAPDAAEGTESTEVPQYMGENGLPVEEG